MHQQMTIAEAQRIFKQYGEVLTKDLSFMVEVIRDNHLDAALLNNHYLYTLSYTQIIFDNTWHYIKILAGNDGTIACLKDRFVSMLERLKANGNIAKVILVDGNADELRAIAAEFPDTLMLEEAVAKSPESFKHFIVADEMVRDEEPHEELKGTSDACLIKAQIYFSNHRQARLYSDVFDGLWANLASEAISPPTN